MKIFVFIRMVINDIFGIKLSELSTVFSVDIMYF